MKSNIFDFFLMCYNSYFFELSAAIEIKKYEI